MDKNNKNKLKKILTIIITIIICLIIGFINISIDTAIIESDMPTWWKILVWPNNIFFIQ